MRITIRPPNARPTVTGLTATPPGPLVALAATTLRATAADADGSVVRVAFFDNGALLGQDDAAPFEWQAAGLGAGTHSFTARAYDNVGGASDPLGDGAAWSSTPIGAHRRRRPGRPRHPAREHGGVERVGESRSGWRGHQTTSGRDPPA